MNAVLSGVPIGVPAADGGPLSKPVLIGAGRPPAARRGSGMKRMPLGGEHPLSGMKKPAAAAASDHERRRASKPCAGVPPGDEKSCLGPALPGADGDIEKVIGACLVRAGASGQVLVRHAVVAASLGVQTGMEPLGV